MNVPMSTARSATTPIFRLETSAITWAPTYAPTAAIATRLIGVMDGTPRVECRRCHGGLRFWSGGWSGTAGVGRAMVSV